MIQAFVGLVGGGKSFCSVRRMMSYMALGGRVASNILLTGYDETISDLSADSPVRDYMRSLGWDYQPKQYVYISYDEMCSNPQWFKKIPAGLSRDKRTLCVVDEATDMFDTLDGGKLRTDSGYRELFHFLRLSRHAHIDVLFVCQDIKTINTRLKSLVANIWRSTDMKNFKLGIFKFGFPFNVFMLQLFDKTGKLEIKREFVRKDSRVFACYQSETFQNDIGVKWDGVAVQDGKIKKGVKKKMSTFWKLLVVGSLALQSWLLYLVYNKSDLQPSVVVSSSSGDSIDYARLFSAVSNLAFNVSSSVMTSVVSQVEFASDDEPKKTFQCFRGKYDFHQCGTLKWIEFDGDTFRLGMPTEFGRVTVIDQYFTILTDETGFITYLLPTDDESVARNSTPRAVSFQGARGSNSRKRNNLVVNGLMGQSRYEQTY